MRTHEQIEAEYKMLCQEAGEAQFKVKAMKERLEQVNVQLLRLVREHDEVTKPKEEHLENNFPEKAP